MIWNAVSAVFPWFKRLCYSKVISKIQLCICMYVCILYIALSPNNLNDTCTWCVPLLESVATMLHTLRITDTDCALAFPQAHSVFAQMLTSSHKYLRGCRPHPSPSIIQPSSYRHSDVSPRTATSVWVKVFTVYHWRGIHSSQEGKAKYILALTENISGALSL